MGFPENLRTLRKEKNMSQEHLAEFLDVSRQAVSKWEQGTSYPEVEKMIMLSKYLSVSLDFLLSDENKKSKNQELVEPKDRILPERRGMRFERVLRLVLMWCLLLVFMYLAGSAIGQALAYL